MTQNIKSMDEKLTLGEFKEFLKSLDINLDNYVRLEFAFKAARLFTNDEAHTSISEFLKYDKDDFRAWRGFGDKTAKLAVDLQGVIQNIVGDKLIVKVNEDIHVLLEVIDRLSKDKSNIYKLIKIRNKAEEAILRWAFE